jgi:ferrous iron transport protein A
VLADAVASSRVISLRRLRVGEKASIVSISVGGELARRIRDMGVVPGVSVEIVGRAPLKDPVAIRLQGFILTLRNNEADWIIVEPEVSDHKVCDPSP